MIMGDNLKKYSFNDLLKQGKLRIPKIQRDYAQGRQSQKVDEIRKVFVHTLLLVVKGKRPATELDFVYGSNQRNAFEPLDGQQRLTTLFLLHWMMGVNLSVSGDKKHSMFTYETRNTSDEFCDELVQHEAKQFVNEAKIKESTPSNIIKGRDWFKWEWKYDPTILSMLVMIDAIYEEMGQDWEMDMSVCRQNLEHITFNLLNLGEFGLSNELFIKMNARGKQLSDFDKLKSTLEEELQIQQKETDEQGNKLATEKAEEKWRTLMDGAWIDFFWHKYARKTIVETESVPAEDRKKDRLRVAKFSELQFKKLLLRLIAIQLFENKPTNEKLSEAAYNIEESKIDNLLFAYTDSLTDLRSDDQHRVVPSTLLALDFNRLMDDVNLLIYKDFNHIYGEISSLLPKISHIDDDDKSLFDSFLGTKVPNDVELTFYAMLLFLRAFPEKKEKKSDNEMIAWYFDKNTHSSWLRNLEDWVRAARNILLNDNNNQRIDKIQYSQEATLSLKQMAADFFSYVNEQELDVESDRTVVLKFLNSSDKTYQRLDNQSMAEERLKAKLILENAAWENSLDKAEQHPYLWGQIRCLLNWSDCQLDSFTEYSNRLLDLLDFISVPENARTYYTAMLVFAPNCWNEGNRLFQYNKHRDNSFKRYLREHTKEGQAYGANIKALIDLWIESYSDKSVKDFLNSVIESKVENSDPWIQCIVKSPSILDEAWNKRIYDQNGHVILAQRQTRDSHCFDPILVYFRNLCREKNIDSSKYKLYDSKGEYEHAFKLEKDSHQYHVEWQGTEGLYTIKLDNNESFLYPISDMVEYMENLITS
jgi:hypothetical protein